MQLTKENIEKLKEIFDSVEKNTLKWIKWVKFLKTFNEQEIFNLKKDMKRIVKKNWDKYNPKNAIKSINKWFMEIYWVSDTIPNLTRASLEEWLYYAWILSREQFIEEILIIYTLAFMQVDDYEIDLSKFDKKLVNKIKKL